MRAPEFPAGVAMKQGLSLRVSQHLALTPQLQQSIRLLQLSTLELSQEVEQMLDENPFLEVSEDTAVREEFGIEQVDTPVSQETQEFEAAPNSIAAPAGEMGATGQNDAESAAESPIESSSEAPLEESWDGDGSIETAPDDSEWGGDAPPRKNNADDGDADASDLARGHESLQDHLHRQALGLRLSEVDRAALHFLIESLNDDGYLEDSLASLAASLAGEDLEQLEEVEERFSMALKLLHHMEPAGVGARSLAECLSLQLLDCKDCEETARPWRYAGTRWSCWPNAMSSGWPTCAVAPRPSSRRRWRSLRGSTRSRAGALSMSSGMWSCPM